MIIKSLGRKSNSIQQISKLVDYIGVEDRRFMLFFNGFENDRQAIIEQFKDNSDLLRKHKGANYFYHEIISLADHPTIAKEELASILFEVGQLYIQERAPKCLVLGNVHIEDDKNIHLHLMVSSNELGKRKRRTLSKRNFANIQKKIEAITITRFPQLKEPLIYAINKEKVCTKNREQELKLRTGKPSHKEKTAELLKGIIGRSQSHPEYITALKEAGWTYYENGSRRGFQSANNKKYRLKTLGLEKFLDRAWEKWRFLEQEQARKEKAERLERQAKEAEEQRKRIRQKEKEAERKEEQAVQAELERHKEAEKQRLIAEKKAEWEYQQAMRLEEKEQRRKAREVQKQAKKEAKQETRKSRSIQFVNGLVFGGKAMPTQKQIEMVRRTGGRTLGKTKKDLSQAIQERREKPTVKMLEIAVKLGIKGAETMNRATLSQELDRKFGEIRQKQQERLQAKTERDRKAQEKKEQQLALKKAEADQQRKQLEQAAFEREEAEKRQQKEKARQARLKEQEKERQQAEFRKKAYAESEEGKAKQKKQLDDFLKYQAEAEETVKEPKPPEPVKPVSDSVVLEELPNESEIERERLREQLKVRLNPAKDREEERLLESGSDRDKLEYYLKGRKEKAKKKKADLTFKVGSEAERLRRRLQRLKKGRGKFFDFDP